MPASSLLTFKRAAAVVSGLRRPEFILLELPDLADRRGLQLFDLGARLGAERIENLLGQPVLLLLQRTSCRSLP